jgi:hypothetical protein
MTLKPHPAAANAQNAPRDPPDTPGWRKIAEDDRESQVRLARAKYHRERRRPYSRRAAGEVDATQRRVLDALGRLGESSCLDIAAEAQLTHEPTRQALRRALGADRVVCVSVGRRGVWRLA